MDVKIIIECANCKAEIELSSNISVENLNREADEFFKKHKTRIGRVYCTKKNLFVRSVK